MIRRIVPVVAMAALLGACSSNSSNNPEPGTVRPARSGADRGPDGNGRGGPGGQGGQGQREDMALRGITLTSDQQQRVDAIRANYRTQMEQARQQAGSDRAAMRQAMQPMMEKQQAEIRNVLNTEQQAQYDRNVTEMRARMQQGGGRRPNG